MSSPFSSVILAAGHSIRMRRDKALLERDGRKMWERQRDLLRDAGAAEILLSARPAQTWAQEAAGVTGVVRDAAPDTGPLGGIAAALASCQHEHLAVLAVDLPRMETAWFTALLGDCAAEGGAVGEAGGFFEPLAAIYPRSLLPLVRQALERRELSLQKLLAAGVAAGRLRVRPIAETEAGLFANWNEPTEGK